MRVVKETLFKIEYSDFERQVHETWPAWAPKLKGEYDRGWCFCADEEVGNDSTHQYSVSDAPADDLDQEDLDRFATRGEGSHLYMSGRLLDELCRRGIIEPGNYLVEVYW